MSHVSSYLVIIFIKNIARTKKRTSKPCAISFSGWEDYLTNEGGAKAPMPTVEPPCEAGVPPVPKVEEPAP